MQEIYLENAKKVLNNKPKIERELKVKITNKGKNIFVDGAAENEFITIEVLEAINFGFHVDTALQLKNEEIIFQTINIKDITKRNDLARIKARIIGTLGKTLKTLETLTECEICLHDSRIAIIGDCEEIEDAIQALTSIIQGSKQSNVYARLEKHRRDKREKDIIYIKNELK